MSAMSSSIQQVSPGELSFSLSHNMLFHGFSDPEITEALQALQAHRRFFQKGEHLFSAGGTADSMGLLLEGSLTIESNDFWGNRTILSSVDPGQFFAETYALLSHEVMLVDVVAKEDSKVLFLQIGNLSALTEQIHARSWGYKFTANLLTISALKNLQLSRRNFYIAPRTIRARVMSYLNALALRYQRTDFDIPFDRQELADYLSVERTALSKELGKMRNDHLIAFRRNHFTLLQNAEFR